MTAEKQPVPARPRMKVIANRNLTEHECSINGKGYKFTAGVETTVPAGVARVLQEAGYLQTPPRPAE